MLLSEEQIQELIAELQGTSNTINDCLPEGFDESDLTEAQIETIDLEIFHCSVCDWWFEVGEEEGQSDDPSERICTNCQTTKEG